MIDIPSSPKDFLQIAHIHKKMLSGTGFLSECSEKFIARFYKYIINFDSSLLFIVRKESKDIVGFVFLTTERTKYYSRFLFNNLFSIIFYPSSFIPFLNAIVRKSKHKDIIKYDVELVHIAIDESSLGKGLGKLLINKGLKELHKKNITALYLQVYADNTAALALYKKMGFKIIGTVKSYERIKLIMKLDFKTRI